MSPLPHLSATAAHRFCDELLSWKITDLFIFFKIPPDTHGCLAARKYVPSDNAHTLRGGKASVMRFPSPCICRKTGRVIV